MTMLKQFLDTTSIHGLKYVGQSKHFCAKAAWLTLILASFSCAVAVIFMTVKAWDEQPTTVQETKPVLLESAEIPEPNVIFCPVHLNFHSLAVNYLNKYAPAPDSKLVKDVKMAAIRSAILSRYREHESFALWISDKVWRACFKANATAEAAGHDCSLIAILSDHCGDHEDLLDFLYKVHYESEELTQEMLEEHCRENIEEADNLSAMLAYSIFFDMLNEKEELETLRPLSDYEIPSWMHKDRPTADAGDIVGQMFNYNVVYFTPELTKEIFYHLFANITGRLSGNAKDHIKTLDDLFDLLAYFVPKGTHLLMRSEKEERLDDPIAKLARNCRLPKDVDCSEVDGECRRYCDLVAIGLDSQGVVEDVLSLSVEEVNRLRDNGPYSLLPWCTWQNGTGPCWRRIVNEFGVCFVSDDHDMGYLKSGSAFAREFIFNDVTTLYPYFGREGILEGGFMDDWMTYSSYFYRMTHYRVMVTPRGQFSLGKLDAGTQSVVNLDEPKYKDEGFYEVEIALDDVVKTTADFAALDPEKRKCLYPHERKLRDFPFYAEANCALESAWDDAERECGCVPWYLRDKFPETRLCEYNGNECFAQVVDGRHSSTRYLELCPSDCEMAAFVVQSKYEDLGQGNTEEKATALEAIKEYVRRRKEAGSNDSLIVKLCKENADFGYYDGELVYSVDHVAVFVPEGSRLVTRITMSATASVIDVISSVGGTLGLFSGFSLLSGAELIYWSGRFILAKLRRKGAGAKRKIVLDI